MAKKKYYGGKMGQKGGELSRKHNEFANMPQEVVHKIYPKASYGLPGEYRDNREGIDMYSKENYNTLKKQIRKPSDA